MQVRDALRCNGRDHGEFREELRLCVHPELEQTRARAGICFIGKQKNTVSRSAAVLGPALSLCASGNAMSADESHLKKITYYLYS